MFRLTCCPVCSLIPMITPQVVFTGERREKGGDEENQKSTVGLGMGLFLIVLLAYATESPFTSCIIFSRSKNSYRRAWL